MYLSLFSLFAFLSPAPLAEEFNFLDETPASESEVADPIEFWPHKLILDSQAKHIMLVWFDEQEPRTQKIPFDAADKLLILQGQRGKPTELHILLDDGTRYLTAMDFRNVQQPSLLMSALLGIQVKKDDLENGLYIKGMKRPSPSMVVGSINSPEAMKPSSKLIDDEAIRKSAVGELLGEDFSIKTAKGKLNKNSVDMEIKRNMSRFRGCYQRALGRSPDLQGSILIQFSVAVGGSVSGARIESSTMKNATVERCILRHMYGLQFEDPVSGNAVFSYPFTFTKI